MDRMAQLFADVLGAPVSVGALAQMVTEAAEGTGLFLDGHAHLLARGPGRPLRRDRRPGRRQAALGARGLDRRSHLARLPQAAGPGRPWTTSA